MAALVLPKRLNMPEPVINIFIEFDETKCPTDDDVMKLVVSQLMQYDRLARIPKLDSNDKLRFHDDITYDSNKLIRRIIVPKGELLHTVAQRHLHDPLNDPKVRGLLPWWEILILEVSTPKQRDKGRR